MRHLLVTNDFPPKLGGIQSYLWELWRRLPPDETTVLCTPYPGDAEFDAASPIPIRRTAERVLLPTPRMIAQVRATAKQVGADLVVLDPALPLGWVGPSLGLPYAVVLHGAEVTVPGRLPGGRLALAHVLRQADRIVAAGGYPTAEAERAVGHGRLPRTTIVPPGVDTGRFRPLDDDERAKARADLGLPPVGEPLIVSVSRLVPRKGMDTLIDAVAVLGRRHREVTLAIAGGGRDERRLRQRAERANCPVHFLGRVPDEDLPRLYGAADVFAMLCRTRWLGLEQEGFGIVFLEAAACGVPVIAGASGGAGEAVADGETGVVLHDPANVDQAADALEALFDDEEKRQAMGNKARQRAVAEFGYDQLSRTLREALQ